MNNYHGILLDAEFQDPNYPEQFKIFAKRKSSSNPWPLYGVEVEADQLQAKIKEIQHNLKTDKPYYVHFYNDEQLIVVFKDKIIRVTPHISTWSEVIAYGASLGIPKEQLDFWPNRFQDEIHYFKPEDFVS